MSMRIADKQTSKSDHKQHKLGAVIVKGNRILSTGHNQMRPYGKRKTTTLHAEEAAIKKLLDRRDLGSLIGSDLYVTRRTRGGAIGNACPCSRCMDLIKSVGIRNIVYSISETQTRRIKL